MRIASTTPVLMGSHGKPHRTTTILSHAGRPRGRSRHGRSSRRCPWLEARPLKWLTILASFCLEHSLKRRVPYNATTRGKDVGLCLQKLVCGFSNGSCHPVPRVMVDITGIGGLASSPGRVRNHRMRATSTSKHAVLHQTPELQFCVGRAPAVHTCPLRLVASPLPTRLLQTCWGLAVSRSRTSSACPSKFRVHWPAEAWVRV
jgi:hypothetical protein